MAPRPQDRASLGCFNSSACVLQQRSKRGGHQAAAPHVICPRLLGCKVDGFHGRLLPVCVAVSQSAPRNAACRNATWQPRLTLQTCASLCAAKGFDRAGA